MNETITTPAKGDGKKTRMAYIIPVANIRQNTEGTYVLEVEMPGVTKEGADVSVEGNELTVTGVRGYPEVNGESLHREIRQGEFRRTFELDATIDIGRISARVENGILRVELPVAEAVKPRRIEVQA